jgi:hypothetical protein
MGYIEPSLGRSETLLYRARFPAVLAAWGVLLASVLAANASGYGPRWME